MGVLAVPQVAHLLEDQRQAVRKDLAADLVQVGRDLRVVRGDRPERVGGHCSAEFRGGWGRGRGTRGGRARVMGRVSDGRGDAGGVAGGRPRSAAPPTSIISTPRRSRPGAPDLGCERLDVHDHEVDRLDALLVELRCSGLHGGRGCRRPPPGGRFLTWPPASGGTWVSSVTGRGLDAVRGEVVPGPVGRDSSRPSAWSSRAKRRCRRGSRPRAGLAPVRFLLRRLSGGPSWRGAPGSAWFRESARGRQRIGRATLRRVYRGRRGILGAAHQRGRQVVGRIRRDRA